MNQITAQTKIEAQYGETIARLEFQGVDKSDYIFGLIKNDLAETVDKPFYVVVNADTVSEVPMPVYADNAYFDSPFAKLEDQYHFFETYEILESEVGEDEDDESDALLDVSVEGELVENAGGYNPYRAKDGKFTTGAGKSKAHAMSDSEMEDLSDLTYEDDQDLDDDAMAKKVMGEIYHKQGFNAKPDVVSDAEFDDIADDHVVLYRNIMETDGADTYKTAFKKGDTHYVGSGIYGNGTYVTPSIESARMYGADPSKGKLLQMVIKPGSKQAIYSDMVSKASKASEKMRNKGSKLLQSKNEGERLKGYKLSTTAKLVADPGIYAASRGYDFMSIDSDNTSIPQTVIFNRGILTVSEGYYE